MIIVYGLLDRQGRRLEKEFAGSVLVWPRKQHLRPLAGVVRVFLMTKFLSHCQQDAAVHCYGRERVWRVHGGESRLRREIRDLLTAAT